MAEKVKIDLNADVGESFGRYVLGNDEELMKYITSANIACGFHAGDPTVMRRTVGFAKQYNTAVGAHQTTRPNGLWQEGDKGFP